VVLQSLWIACLQRGFSVQENQQLTHEPNIDIETLQEQLVACKVREAEAIMLTKDLERRVIELDKHFQVRVDSAKNMCPKNKPQSYKFIYY